MSERKLVHVSAIKVGNYLIVDEVACVAKRIDVSAPGKHKPLSPRRTLGSVFTPTVPHISKTADNTGNIQLKAQGISTSPSSTLKQVEPKTIEDSTNVDISSTSKKRSRSEDEGVTNL